MSKHLSLDQKKLLLNKLDSGWELSSDAKRLSRVQLFDDFNRPMLLAQKIADLSDEMWHHPELIIRFKQLVITIWTHDIDDLVENDFVFASRCDELIRGVESFSGSN